MEVTQVLWGNRIMPFNFSSATNTSRWLNIYNINRFITDFDPVNPAVITIVMTGYVNEPCPAQVITSLSERPGLVAQNRGWRGEGRCLQDVRSCVAQ